MFAEVTDDSFINFNTGNGRLMHNTVETVFRDQMGYVWVGTSFGLNRLDGYSTLSYTHDENDPGSISSNLIKNVFVDSENELWVGTQGGGLNRYLRSNNTFEHFIPDGSEYSINNINVLSITEDGNGDIWIGTAAKSISRYDKRTGYFENFDLSGFDYLQRGLSNVDKLLYDEGTKLWVGMSQGEVYSFDIETKEAKLYSVPPGIDYRNIGAIRDIVQFQDKILFATWSGTVYSVIPGESEFLEVFIPPQVFNSSVVTGIVVDFREDLWISTRSNGLFRFDSTLNLHTHYKFSDFQPNSLASNAIVDLHLDSGNNLWISFLDHGLGMISIGSKMFSKVLSNHKISGFANIYSIVKGEEGNIWFGSRGNGLWRYSPSDKSYKQYLSEHNSGLNSNFIISLYKTKRGKLIVGCDGGFITIFDPQRETFNQLEHDPDDWSNAVFAIEESENHYWAATWGGGIKKVDKQTLKYTSINFDLTDQYQNSIFDLKLVDSVMWVANVGQGLIAYNIYTDQYKVYREYDSLNVFPSEQINHIFVENSNSLWISTDGSWIYRFEPSSETITRFPENYSVEKQVIQSTVVDKHEKVWITTINGIEKLGETEDEYLTFSLHNGLLRGAFNQGAVYYDQDEDLIYAGGVEGAVYFDPGNIIVDSLVNDVVITGFEIMGKKILNPNYRNINKAADLADTIHIFPGENIFTFFFSSMDFKSTHKSKYFYMLEGFNADWVTVPYSNNFVQYTNINPGEYTFMVKACNSDGICSERYTSIVVIVHPEWWQTRLFRIILISSLVLLILLMSIWRNQRHEKAKKKLEVMVINRTREISKQKQRIEKQHAELEKVNETKDKLLSVIGHDLRSPMTSIDQIIELILMRYNKVSDEEMRKFLELLQKTSASTLNLLDDLLLWAQAQGSQKPVQKEVISVDSLLEELLTVSGIVAEKKNIEIEVPAETGVDIFIDKNRILTVLRNLLSNAIKFSHPGSKVTISVQVENDEVIFAVADQGVGISENRIANIFQFGSVRSKTGTSGETGTGFGLSLCKEFVELNGGKIWVESEEGKGSTFSFTVSKA